ncbi:CapA family protein [Halobellus captivus]|uniref:CapA family protein n=1 Tax=Halobellus captivus TaxID=2592614 RepID=UPI00119F8760|nr:CapA family protein [Halobellus captivus]
MTHAVAVSGDAIINRRISHLDDPAFQAVADIFQEADLSFTHLETLIHDFNGPEVYAPAEPGEMAMRSPESVLAELNWLGIDAVSHASNHALDYGYGGLRSTWDAVDAAGIPLAGTGGDLADAREATYFDSPLGRVALISMTTSFTRWSRAGAARYDHRGRPGLNPLGYHYEVDETTLQTVKSLAEQLGMWITEFHDGEWVLNPPGLHNTLTRFVEADVDGVRLAVDDRDRGGNLRAIKNAARQADFVITHLHTHVWDPSGSIADPPAFVRQFARDCVDAGTDLFVGQGSHSPLRPLELYDDTPIFYDPGDLLLMVEGATKQPMEFYERFAHNLDTDPETATIAEVYDARPAGFHTAENPPGGYTSGPVDGLVVPVCDFNDDLSLEQITLTPAKIRREAGAYAGVPVRAEGTNATEILEHLDSVSELAGASIEINNKTEQGVIRL